MSKVKDGQALERLPVQDMSQSATCQPRLGNRLAHVGRQVRDKVRSAVVRVSPAVSVRNAGRRWRGPAVMPDRVNLTVILGLSRRLGRRARRIILGLGLILLALAIAGAVALGQEGQHAMHQPTVHVVTNQSPAAYAQPPAGHGSARIRAPWLSVTRLSSRGLGRSGGAGRP